MLTDEELVRAYRGLDYGVPVHINPLHLAGLLRVVELINKEESNDDEN